MSALSVGIDVGGTFTDLVAVDAFGAVSARKVPSTPSDQSEGVASALALLQSEPVARFVHGTTVATNMLLERAGARVVLIATDGFTDVLHLARQDRASLYDLTRHHPAPLVDRAHTVGARERIEPEGVRLELTAAAIHEIVEQVRALAPDVIAISLLHAYDDSAHEQRIAEALRAAFPSVDVVLSSDVFPEIREYERTATAVAESYLRPGVSRYLERLSERAAALGVPAPGVMTSGGGMRTIAQAARSAASLALSGPAGGVVGAAAVLKAAGFSNALTVDIGGTSADVGLILGGEPLIEPGGRVAGVPISLPRVLVETVSAGGGSIGWIDDGGALRVGPRSAGAVPGPAAFGRGGTQATVTDAHVVLGHITASALSAGVSLDLDAARRAVAILAERLDVEPERLARAMVDIADASVARALRRVSVERGVNPRDCVLVPFGGGGPLHACGLAEQLGVSTIFVPPFPGMLSAVGLAITPERRERMVSVLARADALDADTLRAALERAAEGVAEGHDWQRTWTARMRYVGQGHELDVPAFVADDGSALSTRFGAAHAQRNGFTLGSPAELIGVRHVASGSGHPIRFERLESSEWSAATRIDDGGSFQAELHGPAVVVLAGATLSVKEGWTANPHATGGWLITSLRFPNGRKEEEA
ncbi:MAG: hydantoinase/oxoprolinase family protein [Gemmatimonadota bacterium]